MAMQAGPEFLQALAYPFTIDIAYFDSHVTTFRGHSSTLHVSSVGPMVGEMSAFKARGLQASPSCTRRGPEHCIDRLPRF